MYIVLGGDYPTIFNTPPTCFVLIRATSMDFVYSVYINMRVRLKK